MGIKLSTMRDKVRTIQVAWEDETVDVGVYPGRFTPALVQEVARVAGEAKEGDNPADAIASMVEPVLAWWDVLDEKGAQLPTDAATIAQLPIPFTMAVVTAVGESVRPPARKG